MIFIIQRNRVVLIIITSKPPAESAGGFDYLERKSCHFVVKLEIMYSHSAIPGS